MPITNKSKTPINKEKQIKNNETSVTTSKPTGKHPGGRPTKYKPEYCQGIIDFISAGGAPIIKRDEDGEPYTAGHLPQYLSAYARHIDVSMDTLDEWCKVHPEFSESYKIAKNIQLEHMVNGAMSGVLVPSITIFALKNMHRWTDRQAVDVNATVNVSWEEMLVEPESSARDRGEDEK